jgi:drug/metabolite transporter (DMT)-like permease
MLRGDQNSTWFFVGATFAFAAAAWSFTGRLHLVGGLLLALGAGLIAVGIYVWQRPIDRERAGIVPPEGASSGGAADGRGDPPRI